MTEIIFTITGVAFLVLLSYAVEKVCETY